MTHIRHPRRRTLLRALAPVVALGLVAAACGDDDDDDDAADTTVAEEPAEDEATETTAAQDDAEEATETTAAGSDAEAPEDAPTIRVRGQDFSESITIAEVYGQFLQANGYDVEILTPAGFRTEAIDGIQNGDLDLIIDYIGGSQTALAPDAETSADPDEVMAVIEPLYAEIGATLLDYSPAIDGDAFVVRGDEPVDAISEVPPGEYVFGASAQCFERPQCFLGYTDPDVYGLEFASTVTLEFGPLLGEALAAEEVDAVVWNTTAPQITEEGFKVLEDDLGLHPAQNIAPIIVTSVLDAYGQPLADLLNEMSAQITTEDLLAWNTETDIELRESDDVAAEWLEQEGLLGGTPEDEGDGGDETTTTVAETTTTAAETTVPPEGASGQATLSTPDATIEGVVTACDIPNETDLSMTVEGENAGFQVSPTGDGQVSVVVTGAAEFEGTGQATVSDAGDVSVAGQGSEPDDAAPVVDFTITGTIESC